MNRHLAFEDEQYGAVQVQSELGDRQIESRDGQGTGMEMSDGDQQAGSATYAKGERGGSEEYQRESADAEPETDVHLAVSSPLIGILGPSLRLYMFTHSVARTPRLPSPNRSEPTMHHSTKPLLQLDEHTTIPAEEMLAWQQANGPPLCTPPAIKQTMRRATEVSQLRIGTEVLCRFDTGLCHCIVVELVGETGTRVLFDDGDMEEYILPDDYLILKTTKTRPV